MGLLQDADVIRRKMRILREQIDAEKIVYDSKYAGIYKHSDVAQRIKADRNKKINEYQMLKAELERRKVHGK